MMPPIAFLVPLVEMVLLDVRPPSPSAQSSVDPVGSHGFAAYMIGGFFALGLLVLIALLLGRRPKSVRG
ncbi:MAG TPA: hypothetical protein VKB85_17310 [Propionibacteriaceae bacterium]|nr:hypothetical protein [Propionibacteriaceae bacterium]